MKNVKITSKQIAFIAVMRALANVLGFFAIPIGLTSIHLMQLLYSHRVIHWFMEW